MYDGIKKPLLKIFLILENILISVLIFYFIINNFKDFNKSFFYYLYIFDIFISENYLFFFISLLFSILVLLSQALLWKKIFEINNINIKYLSSLNLFSLIHFKRLFSPFGPISPILNIGGDIKKSTFIYSTYIIFITLGSIFFFFSALASIYPNLIILFSLLFFLILKLLTKRKLGNLNFKNFFILIFLSYLNEFFSYATFLFSLKIFSLNIDFYNSLFIYLTWVIVSSLFPFLYGTGSSELTSIYLANYLGYDSALFALGIIFYRIIITYFPILFLILTKIIKLRK
ncbi:MAG: hypothetical protein KatS3mg094_129 [Candidatus Parcubacteria bacterium]|nr:MAG: hypothetical protein KatS3mg094_129 [Candidatus Parcubacteria bacterium]